MGLPNMKHQRRFAIEPTGPGLGNRCKNIKQKTGNKKHQKRKTKTNTGEPGKKKRQKKQQQQTNKQEEGAADPPRAEPSAPSAPPSSTKPPPCPPAQHGTS